MCKIIKKGMFVLFVMMMLAGISAKTAQADSTISGYLNNYNYTGTVSMNTNGVTATTTFARGNSIIKVTSRCYYYVYSYGTPYTLYRDFSNSATSGGISVYTPKPESTNTVHGGRGIHRVQYNTYDTGNKETNIGYTY